MTRRIVQKSPVESWDLQIDVENSGIPFIREYKKALEDWKEKNHEPQETTANKNKQKSSVRKDTRNAKDKKQAKTSLV
jgi:hypothetical protein